MIKKIIGARGIILLCIIIVAIWFRQGLIFAGAEEELSFYNYTKSLDIYSSIWYAAGTGFPALTVLPRFPYFYLLQPLYKIGLTNVFLEALTFLTLILIGTLSTFYLIKEIVASELKEEWRNIVPFLAAISYFLNPFSMTQIWGRVVSYQFFAFALIPVFLLLFILSIKRRNLFFCFIAALFSFLLSTAYVSPAVVVTSWANIIIYLAFYIFTNRNNYKRNFFAIFFFILLFLLWTIFNLFWIYPLIRHGEILITNYTPQNNIESLKGVSQYTGFNNVIRLIHKKYYDGVYGSFYHSFFVISLSWILPILFLFSISTLKKTSHFLFFIILFAISLLVSIGANFPTGWFLIWLFQKFTLLQVLRNPYEKFGINLVLAYTPFFAVGLLIFSEKMAAFYKASKLKNLFIVILMIMLYVVLVFPLWKGNFAKDIKTNYWVKVPEYYTMANNWLNSQRGDFAILQLPLIPRDGVTYTWEYPYDGIEPSEFLFDRLSIGGYFVNNKNYYSILMESFGANGYDKDIYKGYSNIEEFKDENLINELSKLNIRFIVLHFDTDYDYRKTTSPKSIQDFLNSQAGIEKINQFGKLEIYKVNIPDNINLIYSPQLVLNYRKINNSHYIVDVKDAKQEIDLYFLQQFYPAWEAFIDGKRIENHSEVFSYANRWRINKLGNYQVEIKFLPQESFDKSVNISKIGVFVSAFLITFYLFGKKTIKHQS